jgi:cytochrome bd-type quinol oxidase subunit 1
MKSTIHLYLYFVDFSSYLHRFFIRHRQLLRQPNERRFYNKLSALELFASWFPGVQGWLPDSFGRVLVPFSISGISSSFRASSAPRVSAINVSKLFVQFIAGNQPSNFATEKPINHVDLVDLVKARRGG